MLLNSGVGEDFWESLRLQGDQTNQSSRISVLNIHWKDWSWSWSSNTLAIWCEELTHWKKLWCWERLKARGEVVDRGWDGCMKSQTQWTRVWASFRSCWCTGKPGALQSLGSQRVGHNLVTELSLIHLSGVSETQSSGLAWRLSVVLTHHILLLGEQKFLWLKSVARKWSWTSHLFKFIQWLLSLYIWYLDLKAFFEVLGTEFLLFFLMGLLFCFSKLYQESSI